MRIPTCFINIHNNVIRLFYYDRELFFYNYSKSLKLSNDLPVN